MDVQRKACNPGRVCSCNDLYIADMYEVLASGERRYKEVFVALDMASCCCGCADEVAALVQVWCMSVERCELNGRYFYGNRADAAGRAGDASGGFAGQL